MNDTAEKKPLYHEVNGKPIEIGFQTATIDTIKRTYYRGYDDISKKLSEEANIKDNILGNANIAVEVLLNLQGEKKARRILGSDGKTVKKSFKYNTEQQVIEEVVLKDKSLFKTTFEYSKKHLVKKTSYQDDGHTLKTEESFNQNKQVISFKQFDQKGRIDFTVDYSYFSNGVLKEKKHSDKDRQKLIQTETFDEKGFLVSKVNHLGKKSNNSAQRYFYGDSYHLEKIIEYRDGSEKISKVKEYDEDQQVSKLKLYQRNGHQVATEIEFHPNGKKKKETFFKDKTSLPVKITEYDNDENLTLATSIRYNGRKRKKTTIAQQPYHGDDESLKGETAYTKIVKYYNSKSGNATKGDVYDPFGNVIIPLYYHHKTNERLDAHTVTAKKSNFRRLAFVSMTMGVVSFLLGMMSLETSKGAFALLFFEVLSALLYLFSEKMAINSTFKKHKIIPEEVTFEKIGEKMEHLEANKKLYKKHADEYIQKEKEDALKQTKENMNLFKKKYFVKAFDKKTILYQEIMAKSFGYFVSSKDFSKTQKDIHSLLKLISDWNNSFDVQVRDVKVYRNLYQRCLTAQKKALFSKGNLADFVDEFALFYKSIRPMIGPAVKNADAKNIDTLSSVEILLIAEQEIMELEKLEN